MKDQNEKYPLKKMIDVIFESERERNLQEFKAEIAAIKTRNYSAEEISELFSDKSSLWKYEGQKEQLLSKAQKLENAAILIRKILSGEKPDMTISSKNEIDEMILLIAADSESKFDKKDEIEFGSL